MFGSGKKKPMGVNFNLRQATRLPYNLPISDRWPPAFARATAWQADL